MEDEDLGFMMGWLSTQAKVVQRNVKVVSAQELGQGYMLHIDKNTPKVFVPRMPSSAASSENPHCARVTVSPHLQGCMFGYARIEGDYLDGGWKAMDKRDPWRGGYDICKIEFSHCLQPNAKMVFDAQRSHEHWLVSYRKELIQYVPKKVGKVFISAITFKKDRNDGIANSHWTAYIQVDCEEGFLLTPVTGLSKGYWKLECFVEDFTDPQLKENYDHYQATPCSVGEFNEQKGINAALLSHGSAELKRPAWANLW